MQVSCPRCRALLILPAEVVGREACCPSCHTVFRAESGRPPAPAPPPAPRIEFPVYDEEEVPVPAPPVRLGMEAFAGLVRAGRWLRVTAVFDIVAVTALAILAFNHHHRAQGLMPVVPLTVGDVLWSVVCTLGTFGPLVGLLAVAGSRLATVRLQGVAQAGLAAGIGMSVLLGFLVLAGLAWVGEAQRLGDSPVPALGVVLIAGATSALNLFAAVRAALARKDAIASGLTARLAEPSTGSNESAGADAVQLEDGPAPAQLGPGSRLRRARRGARGLQAAAVLFAGWYAVGCMFLAATGEFHLWRIEWMSLAVRGLGLLPLAAMFVGAYHLRTLDHRGWALTGSLAALLVAGSFGIDFLRCLTLLADRLPPQDQLLTLGRSTASLAIAVCSLFGAVSGWQSASDPDVRRAFRR
jgi:hypothetical protein